MERVIIKTLKECPFCGEKAEIIRDMTYNAETGETLAEHMWFVWCTKCSALVSGATEDEAVGLWNRRTNNDNDQML